MNRSLAGRIASGVAMAVVTCVVEIRESGADTLVLDGAECAGISGFRADWNRCLPVREGGMRLPVDRIVTNRGQTAVWDGVNPGALAFDGQHRSLLVRFPDAAKKIAAAGKEIEKLELVLPYADEEIWPPGAGELPGAQGYRYRTNWDVDAMYRGMVREKTKKQTPQLAYREERPNWHAVAYALRKPWQSPTYNAASPGVYWKRFGATDTNEDRYAEPFGPVEVSSYKPEGRMDVTALVKDAAFGKTLGERLRLLADCGFIISKQEIYDARYALGAYEWAMSCGPRAIVIRQPKLVVTLSDGKEEKIALPSKCEPVPGGAPTAIVPSPEDVARLSERFMAKPAWMPDWQFAHVKQLMALESGAVEPFYYRLVPEFVVSRIRGQAAKAAKRGAKVDVDYEVYLAWLDYINSRPLRYWEGHLTAANDITSWYNFHEAMPAAIQDIFLRNWQAWMMSDRETAPTDKERKNFADVSGALIHPMADDPRVGVDATGAPAVFNQGDTYYKTTGDWRGNKSYYRSGFTRMMSTANFNSSATAGALLCGQIIGSERAVADGRAGMRQFPFWMWTYSGGVGQEFIDHYYWAIATAGNKMFADFAEAPQDRMLGWSILHKTINDLAIAYHPNLKKLLGPASRTYCEHVLGVQDGLYHILHVISPRGALSDLETGTLPLLTAKTSKRPIGAWGHDYPARAVALNSLTGPWGAPWFREWVDEKPLPWFAMLEKEGDPVCLYFGENYGLASIRSKHQRIHVLGHWRRKAESPASMTDIGTMDLRIGFNQTTIGNDYDGVISQQGVYRTYQHQNKLIMLAKPKLDVITTQAAEHKFGQRTIPAQEIRTIQCTAALFNYEQPAPAWEIFVDDKKVTLPATAKINQVITIRDGVSYLAFRALAGEGITLEAGQPQTQSSHEQTNIQPALMINALIARDPAPTGFVVEMGDGKEYGSFVKFQEHIRQATLTGDPKATVTYSTGVDTLAASWDSFIVNGADPASMFRGQGLWQDTTLGQMGEGRLEKCGAVIERSDTNSVLMLQAFPMQHLYVAVNPVPVYQRFTFREPGGVQIAADGAVSMGYWAVRDSREIEIKYCEVEGKPRERLKEAGIAPARVLWITGAKAEPKVTLNGKEALLKPWKDGWQVSLTGELLLDCSVKICDA